MIKILIIIIAIQIGFYLLLLPLLNAGKYDDEFHDREQ